MIAVGNFIRMLVRPAVTLALVGALIYIAVVQHDRDVVVALVAAASSAVTFWFSDRGQQNRPVGGGAQ